MCVAFEVDILGNFDLIKRQAEDETLEMPVEGEGATGTTAGGGGGGTSTGGGLLGSLGKIGKIATVLTGILAFVTNLDPILEVMTALFNVLSFALAPVAATLTKQLVPLLLSLVQGIVGFFQDPVGALRDAFSQLSTILGNELRNILSAIPFVSAGRGGGGQSTDVFGEGLDAGGDQTGGGLGQGLGGGGVNQTALARAIQDGISTVLNKFGNSTQGDVQTWKDTTGKGGSGN